MLCKDTIKASYFKKNTTELGEWLKYKRFFTPVVTHSGLKLLHKSLNSLSAWQSKIGNSAVSKESPSPTSKYWQVKID